MNRLILIGNGFDLAHGMKTSYNDFILWYLKKCFNEANNKNVFEDDLIEITKTHNSWQNYMNNVSELVDYFYKKNLVGLFKDADLYIKFNASDYIFKNPFKSEIKSPFFERLIVNCSNSNWVDIENEFYTLLKSLLPSINDHADFKINQLKPLNDALRSIINELNCYLKGLECSAKNDDYFEIFNSPISAKDICTKIMYVDEEVAKSMVLNFNYTTTPKKYLTGKLVDTEINYIHGKIDDPNNQLIFGSGDELDSNYSKLELQKVNDFFTYIKSFGYFKTSNYHNLVRFIEGEEFQVFILGHSCGLSDRTMLNMIFEHENCKSIKIYYHEREDGTNDFTNLTQEIARHFKDKVMMRKKIVPFDKSEPMPQVESSSS